MRVWESVCARLHFTVTRPTFSARCERKAEHLKSTGWLQALMGLTGMTTGGLLSVNQRWGGEGGAREALEAPTEGGGKKGGGGREVEWWKGRDAGTGRVISCNEVNSSNELHGPKNKEGHLKFSDSGTLKVKFFGGRFEHPVSLSVSLYFPPLSQTLLPKVYIISIKTTPSPARCQTEGKGRLTALQPSRCIYQSRSGSICHRSC